MVLSAMGTAAAIAWLLTKKKAAGATGTAASKLLDARGEFALKLLDPATRVAQANGWRLPAGRDLIVTQAAHESAWGRSQLAAQYNNLFGFTDGGWSAKGLPTVDMPTTEWKNGVPYKTSRKFRRYGSWEESLNDWARLMNVSARYRPVVEALKNGDAQGFFSALGKSGYATDPGYGDKLARVYRDVESVTV